MFQNVIVGDSKAIMFKIRDKTVHLLRSYSEVCGPNKHTGTRRPKPTASLPSKQIITRLKENKSLTALITYRKVKKRQHNTGMINK